MKLLYSLLLCCSSFLIQNWQVECFCENLVEYSGRFSYTSESRDHQSYEKCWYIDPPHESIIHINIVDINLNDPYCDNVFIKLTDYNGKYTKICQHFSDDDCTICNKTMSMLGAVNITLVMRYTWDYVSFSLEYDTESTICSMKDNFKCSTHQCVRPEQVCDGVKDCDNGLDESKCGILSIRGENASRTAINWLKNHQKNFGWGKNTHRAVTSLYLSGAAKFRGNNTDEEIVVKQLQLQIAAALLRNLTEPISVNELSMYTNALLATCHNVRNIFSEDLLEILASRAFSKSPPSPGAYLTLCNANWPFSEKNVHQLLNLLTKEIEYPFEFEIQAMTIMALSCLQQKNNFILSMQNASSIYNETIESFMENQRQDGSFGNAHTTAMVLQALVSSGEMDNNLTNAMQFLIKNLNSSSVDFLSVYLSLPLFNGKTLVDIGSVDCLGHQRKLEENEDILDVLDKLGKKIHIHYSLYIGDNKNVVHNMYLKVPENSTVYDVMKVAQIADHKYKFSKNEANGHMYIYEIADLVNDMEAEKFWLFYIASNNITEPKHFTQSPDQIVMSDRDHLIMWYKSPSI